MHRSLLILVLLLLGSSANQGQTLVETKLRASDAAAGDHFGWSVAIDGNHAIIGAPYNADFGDASGAAYIFQNSGGIWSQQAKLLASDEAKGDFFGRDVDIEGDYAAVSADFVKEYTGAVYIFHFKQGQWIETAKLTAADAAKSDYFGAAISLSGDRILIGANYKNNSGDRWKGAAYIFRREGENWLQEAKLLPADLASMARFGRSCALSGDWAAVGGSYVGAVYLFKRNGNNWIQMQKITSGIQKDEFGSSMALSDSANYLLVGAAEDNSRDFQSGSAYLYQRNGDTWSLPHKITASNGSYQDYFGRSAAISERYAIVGGDYKTVNSQSRAGSAYIFARKDFTWTQTQILTASNYGSWNYFGYAVGMDPERFIVGAWGYTYNEGSGIAYIYEQESPPVLSLPQQLNGIEDTPLEINLGDYVTALHHTKEEMTWTITGSNNISINITPQRRAILTPHLNWHGSEILLFKVMEPHGASAEQSVRIDIQPAADPPVAPALLEPKDQALLTTLRPALRWRSSEDPDSGKVHYRLRVSETSDLQNPLLSTLLADTSFIPFMAFTPNKTYYWGITAVDPDGLEAQSPIFSFTLSDPYPRKVLAHYLGWYAGPSYTADPGRHWQNGHLHQPLIGEYDSREKEVLEYHTLTAFASGISGMIHDWYGPNSYEDAVLSKHIQVVKEINKDHANALGHFKLAACYNQALESYPGMERIAAVRSLWETTLLPELSGADTTYLWVWDDHLKHQCPVLFFYPNTRMDMRQFHREIDSVLPSGLSWFLVTKELPDPVGSVGSAFPWIQVDGLDSTNWRGPGSTPYLQWFYQTACDQDSLQFLTAGVWPGWHAPQQSPMTRANGATYDSTWRQVHHFASLYQPECNLYPKWVLIETWNDWHQGSEIEPGREFAFKYIQATKNHAADFSGLNSRDTTLAMLLPAYIFQAHQAVKMGRASAGDSSRQLIREAIDLFFKGQYQQAISQANIVAGVRAPSVEAIKVGMHDVKLQWQPISNASHYMIYCSKDTHSYSLFGKPEISIRLSANTTEYVLTNLDSFITYYIGLTSVDTTLGVFNESWHSNWIIPAHIIKIITDVELRHFSAICKSQSILLEWIVLAENNYYGFELERSPDKSRFQSIGFVPGQGVIKQQKTYSFEDTSPLPGVNHYRLKQISKDGQFSILAQLEVPFGRVTQYALHQNKPNPFNNQTIISYDLPSPENARIEIYNFLGQLIRTLIDQRQEAGSHLVVWDGTDEGGKITASGIYLYTMTAGRFRLTRKLFLLR